MDHDAIKAEILRDFMDEQRELQCGMRRDFDDLIECLEEIQRHIARDRKKSLLRFPLESRSLSFALLPLNFYESYVPSMKEFIEKILGLFETTHSILMSHTRKLEKLESSLLARIEMLEAANKDYYSRAESAALEEMVIALQHKIEAVERWLGGSGLSGSSRLSLASHNFRIPSEGWKEGAQDGISYLENPEGDVWELRHVPNHPELAGEQLFTWKAAMRETKRAGKRMPTDEEFSQLLNEKSDMPNLLLAGYRDTDGLFAGQSTHAYLWSSTESAAVAWYRNLDSGHSGVFRYANNQAYGFSVRCVKD